MGSSVILISIFTPLLFSIILTLEVDGETNTYFNDEINEPPPQMETFNNYEEMRKYLENNSNVELIDNPTFDTYLSAYNLHHNKENKPETSQSLSMQKRSKRRALPFPYDFIKFELSDAREPDAITKEFLKKYRENERKSKETARVNDRGRAGKKFEDTLKLENFTQFELDEIISTTTQQTLLQSNKTLTTPKTNKIRRIARRIARKKINQTASIKRIDTNIEETSNQSKDDDLEIHETQNVHYYAAAPTGEGMTKHKISNIFPHEVHKAIDFVLAENKQAQSTSLVNSGKGAHLKFIQIPIYHKQPYYGDKIALYQATKVSNKHHPSDYDEAYNKYLHSYSLPLTATNVEFKQSPQQHQQQLQGISEEKKNPHYSLQSHQHPHYSTHNQYHQQHPKYYTIQTPTANSLLSQQHENSLHETKQYAPPSNIPVATSHQNQMLDASMSNVNSGQTKIMENNLSQNHETGALTALPEINQVHTIIQPQAVAVKVIPEINYVFHQDIAATPVTLKLTQSNAPISTYTAPSAPMKILNDDSNDKSVQTIDMEKSVMPQYTYKNYDPHVYAPISLQNEMLAKAVLINHGYKFDDLTNTAGSTDANAGNIPGKNNIEASSPDVDDLNEKYSIKQSPSPSPSQLYIPSTTPINYHSYLHSTTEIAPLEQKLHKQHNGQTKQYHKQLLSITTPSNYIENSTPHSHTNTNNNNNNNNNKNNDKESHFETSSQHYNELSSLIGKSPTDQIHGLNYLIEKELQNNQFKPKDKVRPQDNRAPILFHPDSKNGGDNFRGKSVYINEYGYKQIKNENSASSGTMITSTEKPIKEEEQQQHDINSVVHITPPPQSPATSYKHIYNLSPNYKIGTKLYGLNAFKDTSGHGLQYASKYAFGYRVRDFHTGNDFGHKQKRDHDGVTRGEYHILLPDGRVQNVRYTADDSGFHADVSFESGP